MGTDIHCYVERRTKVGRTKRWAHVAREIDFEVEPEDGLRPFAFVQLDRNYSLFDLLGRGAAPIMPSRGLPKDLSPEVRAEAARWEGDSHDHSWLTLEELLAHDWSVHEYVEEFATLTLHQLHRLGSPTDVRLVFYFDS